MSTAPTLYRNGRLFCPADPTATALLVRDGRIAWLGEDAEAPSAGRIVDLDGGFLAPAFVDAHVHATDTGITLQALDLTAVRSAAALLAAVAAYAATLPSDAVVLGHGWDESTWGREQTPPEAAQLLRASGGRTVYLSQISVHSALVTADLLAHCPADTPGYAGSGWLRRDAHHVVREIAMGSIAAAQRGALQRAALATAASLGIAAIHECGGPGTSDERDFVNVLALGATGELPQVYGYWGELGGAAKARELGAVGAGGDLYADGALGSQTAHLRVPYEDVADGGCGHGYVSVSDVAKHLVACAAEGMQGGFHAIGDAAIATVLAGFGLAAAEVGIERIRAARHRVEHLEILDKQLIAGLVEFGITASVQPAFDRLWGGRSQMYAQRLGIARSLASNPIGALAGVGVALAFGSDSPVTPLDPWGTIRAAMHHHNPVHRVGPRTAFAAHTRGGWRAVHDDESGQLLVGAPATFAVWDTPGGLVKGLPVLLPDGEDEPMPPLPVCRRTVVRGSVIFNGEEPQ
jgi:predicted amidohydrolase YtcJ